MNKKNLIVVLISTFLFMTDFKKGKEEIDFNVVKQELDIFINKAKDMSVSKGKYNVYLLKFTTDKKGYYVTIGYFSFLFEPSVLKKFKYYFVLNNELILVEYPAIMKQKYSLINKSFSLITDKNIIKARTSKEPFLGSSCGYVYSKCGNEITKTFYDDDSSIPRDKAIFPQEPYAPATLIDSTTLKKMLESK